MLPCLRLSVSHSSLNPTQYPKSNKPSQEASSDFRNLRKAHLYGNQSAPVSCQQPQKLLMGSTQACPPPLRGPHGRVYASPVSFINLPFYLISAIFLLGLCHLGCDSSSQGLVDSRNVFPCNCSIAFWTLSESPSVCYGWRTGLHSNL